MSAERDLDRIVRSWMEEGVTALPEHVLDAVVGQLPATPQRRALGFARRFFLMNKPLAIGLVTAAAILVVALVGLNLGPGSGPDPGGEPSTTPTSSSTPAPTLTAALPLPVGALDPGTYLMPADLAGAAFEFTVPAGWTNNSDNFVQKNTDSGSLLDITTGVMFSAWTVDHVFTDACVGEGTEQPIEDSVQALATALVNQAGREEPERGRGPIIVDGNFPGETLAVDLVAPADLTDCGGRLRTWPGQNGDLNAGWIAGPGQVDKVYITDVDGTRLVMVATYWPGTTTADKIELEGIIASKFIR
jgi:hypothetical protein